MDTETTPVSAYIHNSCTPEAPDDREAACTHNKIALIAQGAAEVAAGLVIDGDALDVWLDQLDIDLSIPMPEARAKATKSG